MNYRIWDHKRSCLVKAKSMGDAYLQVSRIFAGDFFIEQLSNWDCKKKRDNVLSFQEKEKV